MIPWRIVGAIPLMAAVIAACSSSSTETREIGGHRFKIPKDYLVDGTIFYLPTSQNRGLRFILNPQAPLPQQHLVSIDPEATCPRMDTTKPADPSCRVVPIPLSLLEQEHIRRAGDDVWWEYRFEKTGELVAFCSALADGDGLCTHHGLYDNLPYSLGLRDSQMGDLIRLRKRIEDKMAEWEKAANR